MTGALGAGEFAAGGLELIVMLGALIISAALTVQRWLPELEGAARASALGLLTVCGVLAAELVPLTFGVLSRITPLLVSLMILGGVALAAARTRGAPLREPAAMPAGRPRPSLSTALGAIGLLGTTSAWLAYLWVNAGSHIESTDAMGFHLPGVIRFIQTGSLWHVTQYLSEQAQGYYPQNGDALLLALALPWHSLAFVRYVEPPLLALAGIGVYGTARELGAPTGTSALSALALIAIRPTLGAALPELQTDPAFLAGFACGMLFLIRHGRTGSRRELFLAGLGLGVAFGTKWYGLTDVPALFVAWALLWWRGGGALRRLARDGAVLVAGVALTGGLWPLRNLVLTGNPVFDYKLRLFGLTILPAPPSLLRDHIGFTLAHYAGQFGILRRYVWPVFRQDFGPTAALIALGAIAAVGADRHSVRERRDLRIPILALAALLCAVAYAFTPYSAQGLRGAPTLVSINTRYGAPALILAAPLLAWVAGRRRPLRLTVEALLLVCLLLDLHRYLPAPASHVVIVVVILVALGVVPWLGRMAGLGFRGPLRRAALAATAVVALGALGYHYQRRLAAAPYAPGDPTVNWVLARAPAGVHIGITGIWSAQGLVPVAPLFGPRLQNTVTYIGPVRDHRLEQYTRGSHFIAALQRGRYPLLEIGTGIPPVSEPAEARWATSAGYRLITRSSRLILMGRART